MTLQDLLCYMLQYLKEKQFVGLIMNIMTIMKVAYFTNPIISFSDLLPFICIVVWHIHYTYTKKR